MVSEKPATYEEKVAHIKVVAQRGAEAREMAEEAGVTDAASEQYAGKVFNAMATVKLARSGGLFSISDVGVLVLSDTPADREDGYYSRVWAEHVRDVFVASFVAGRPRPKPPAV